MSQLAAKPRTVQLSDTTQRVVARLRSVAIGETVQWDELEDITGRPRDAVRDMARTAARLLQDEEKMHFRTCVSVGVERVDFTTVAREVVPGQRRRIGTLAGRMMRTTRNVIVDGLDKADREQIFLHQTIGGLAQLACTDASYKHLRAPVDDCVTVEPMTVQEAAALLFNGRQKI